MKKITIFTASNGENLKMANRLAEITQEMGANTEVVDIVALNLPMYTPTLEQDKHPKDIDQLAAKIKNSDGVVFLAPEYNGLIPPVLNNMIAWISVTTKGWRDAFNGKPALIGTHSGGGGAQVLMAMRMQLSYIGMNVIGRQLVTNSGKELKKESAEACITQLL
jgi:NAD(P)H-dependent FMN reductase